MDLVVVTILFVMCYMGFGHGFFAEFLNVIGAVSMTALTINYSGLVTKWVQSYWHWQSILIPALVFWGLFLSLLYGVHLIIRAVTSTIKWERLHWSIQGCGLILGGLRGLWWAGFTLVVLSASGVTYFQESVETRSVIGPRLLPIATTGLEYATAFYPGSQYHTEVLVPPIQQKASDDH